jgi:trans-2-enoyl-CoA reductase
MEMLKDILNGPVGAALVTAALTAVTTVAGAGPGAAYLLIMFVFVLLASHFTQKRKMQEQRVSYEALLKEKRERIDEERVRVDVIRKETGDQVVQCFRDLRDGNIAMTEAIKTLSALAVKLKG